LRAVADAHYRLIAALAVIAGAAIALAFVLIVVDVGIRTIGLSPPAFTSAVVEYILLYFTLLSAPYLVRQKSHVYIDALVARLPLPLKWGMEKLAYSICILTALLFAYIGFDLFIEAVRDGRSEERSVDVPLWIGYAPLAPVFILVAIEFGRFLLGRDSLYRDRTQVGEGV
jgi:TRAP-type C4-dicarboxylate transport system permease small subunit